MRSRITMKIATLVRAIRGIFVRGPRSYKMEPVIDSGALLRILREAKK